MRWLVITLTDCGVSRCVSPSGVAVVLGPAAI